MDIERPSEVQAAYDRSDYRQAKAALKTVRGELGLLNRSAVASPNEGSDETLTLHRLGLAKPLGRSFRTTNCIENVNALLGQRTDKVDRWRNSDQKYRWLAAALLDIEPRLRRVCGCKHLVRLRAALSFLRPVNYYRGDPEALLAERRKLQAARALRKQENLRLRQRRIPWPDPETVSYARRQSVSR